MFERRETRRRAVATLTLALTMFGILATAAGAIPSRRLVWNASASAPVGLYWRVDAEPEPGDLVLAWAPFWARLVADDRHYLPLAVPLVKRIAAGAGDIVCTSGRDILINGERVAHRLETDSAGRLLPHWEGCNVLPSGEFFLLMPEVRDSFDGRYFGVTERQDVIGRLVPLWTR